MNPVILDTAPWGLITQKPGKSLRADDCRAWFRQLIAAGRNV